MNGNLFKHLAVCIRHQCIMSPNNDVPWNIHHWAWFTIWQEFLFLKLTCFCCRWPGKAVAHAMLKGVTQVRHFTMGWFLKQLKLCEGTSKGTASCQCKWLRTCRKRMGHCWWCWDHRVWYFRARSILTLEICHAHCISLCSSTRLCCGCGHAQQIPKSQGLYSWIWSKGLASFIATGSPLWHLRILVQGLIHTQHRLAGHKVNWSVRLPTVLNKKNDWLKIETTPLRSVISLRNCFTYHLPWKQCSTWNEDDLPDGESFCVNRVKSQQIWNVGSVGKKRNNIRENASSIPSKCEWQQNDCWQWQLLENWMPSGFPNLFGFQMQSRCETDWQMPAFSFEPSDSGQLNVCKKQKKKLSIKAVAFVSWRFARNPKRLCHMLSSFSE